MIKGAKIKANQKSQCTKPFKTQAIKKNCCNKLWKKKLTYNLKGSHYLTTPPKPNFKFYIKPKWLSNVLKHWVEFKTITLIF
jgi:hypothetical protein